MSDHSALEWTGERVHFLNISATELEPVEQSPETHWLEPAKVVKFAPQGPQE